jgi:NAD(P)-dependent dehydrogenase (short-subunit alcohol dehydrogenase family)
VSDHAGRTYAVTGSGSGIGAATTAFLRERGARVIACDLKDAEVTGDLSTPEGRAAVADGVARLAGGRLDGVVANAGGGAPQTMLQLNFFGAVATLSSLRPLLAKAPEPRAVAVSSIASLQPVEAGLVEACLSGDEAAAVSAQDAAIAMGDAGSLYAAAKTALNRWCRKAATGPDWAGKSIPLNVVAPGVIDTPAAAWILDNPEARAEMMSRTPLPTVRPGRPDQMAALIAWLAGPENALMSGQVLFADGGVECAARGELRW